MRAATMGLFATIVSLFASADAQELAVGQRWTFGEERPGESLVIGRIDRVGSDTAVSVSVFRPMSDKIVIGGHPLDQSVLAHVPLSKDVLAHEAKTLIESNAMPAEQFEEGYGYWKAAVDAGEAGVFGITVDEIVAVNEQAFREAVGDE